MTMKTLFGTTALVMAMALPAFAQDAAVIVTADTTATAQNRTPFLPGINRGVRASDFIGKRVYVTETDMTGLGDSAIAEANADWDDAGEISDLIISLAGDSEAVLVDFGGFLGIGEKTVAVSMADLTMVPDSSSPDDYFIVFQGSQATLEAAPEYDDNMVFEADPEPMNGLTVDTDASMMNEAMVDYSTMTENDLVGKRVYGLNNEDIGEISSVSLSADNKIEAAVVDVGGFLGMGEKPVALTSDMLRMVADPDGGDVMFRVNATQEQLEALPTHNY
jgi:sporulation protein YlmC with PRC-barrel domain